MYDIFVFDQPTIIIVFHFKRQNNRLATFDNKLKVTRKTAEELCRSRARVCPLELCLRKMPQEKRNCDERKKNR